MSTPEQPDSPALTRKQIREIRNTGATPIVSGAASAIVETAPPSPPRIAEDGAKSAVTGVDGKPEAPPTQAAPAQTTSAEAASAEPAPSGAKADAAAIADRPRPISAAPLPRAALPAALGNPPAADASVDLGVAPLTRRQARQQERIRTASVPVITPEVAASHAAGVAPSEPARPTDPTSSASAPASQPPAGVARTAATADDTVEGPHDLGELFEQRADSSDGTDRSGGPGQSGDNGRSASDPVGEQDRPVVSPQLGADLLEAESVQAALPPSFDHLISRTVTGSVGAGSALILSQTPSAPPLVAPIAATGEMLITGTFNLPEGLGSTGHANGTADGKEVDAVLIDGELPAHSSPTPIAASAAISTVRTPGDVITPPTPEKGGRLMLTLAITAGVLALALVGVLILAFVTGVFS